MKKTLFTLLSLILVLSSCEKSNNQNIEFSDVVLGGCNGQSFEEKNELKDQLIDDSVSFRFENDSLKVFTGFTYICCAPFTAKANISQDTIEMVIQDQCNVPEENCYCRCNCYYTFDFKFAHATQDNYYARIVIIDPREEAPRIFFEGKIK